MYYHRHPVKGEWKEFKFSGEEVAAIKEKSRALLVKDLVVLRSYMDKIATEHKLARFTENEILAVFNRLQDTYKDLSSDFVSNMLADKKKAEDAAKAAPKPETAPAPVETAGTPQQ